MGHPLTPQRAVDALVLSRARGLGAYLAFFLLEPQRAGQGACFAALVLSENDALVLAWY